MIDLLRLSEQDRERFLHLQAIVERQKEKSARIRALRAYYDGEHPVYLTQRQQEFLGKLLSEGEFEFAHNLVRSVIDTLRERLSVSGFAVNGATLEDADGAGDDAGDGADSGAAQIAATFWAWWKAARLDAKQIDLYRNALRDGAAYVMVDYDNEAQRPRFVLHQADDGSTGITVHRDPEDPDRILYVNRYWYTYDPLKPGATGTERKTTYLPGEIRKYRRAVSETGWAAVRDEDDAAWPLPWVDGQGRPLGIPVIEFANPGGSEIAQIIGLQDALNKAWLDLIAAADAAGFPLLVIEYETNGAFNAAQGDDDDLEGSDEFRIAPGRMLEVDDGRAHRIEGANLEQLIAVIWVLTAAIAGVSRTPQYYLKPTGGADVPSGEALKQLESGLVKRAQERQLLFGQAWEQVFETAHRVAAAFGPPLPSAPELEIDVTWDDPEVRNDLLLAQRGEALKRLNVPDEVIWQTLGFSPEQIAAWRDAQMMQQAQQIATVARALTTTRNENGALAGGESGPVAENGAQR